MGGVEPTLGYLRELLERGVSVVSANKQLLARHGAELQRAAERGGAQLRFEASACAAIPVVHVLHESLAAAGVDEVIGIVNGTTNFMLTRDGTRRPELRRRARPRRRSSATPRPTRPRTSAAPTPPPSSRSWPRSPSTATCTSTTCRSRASTRSHDDDVAFANELGYAVKLLATRALSRRRHRRPRGARARAARAPARARRAAASTPSCCAGARSARSRCRARAPAAPRRPPP